MTVPFPKVFHRRTAFPFIFIGRERSRLQVVCVPTSSTGTSCGGARHSTRTRRTVPAPASRPGCAVSSSPLSVRPGRGVPSPPPPSPCPPTLPQGRRLQHPRLPRAPVTPATCPALRRARACCCQRGRSRWVRRRRRPSPRPCATAWPIRLRRRRAWHPRLLFGAVACARTRVTRSSHGRRGPPPPTHPYGGCSMAWHGPLWYWGGCSGRVVGNGGMCHAWAPWQQRASGRWRWVSAGGIGRWAQLCVRLGAVRVAVGGLWVRRCGGDGRVAASRPAARWLPPPRVPRVAEGV